MGMRGCGTTLGRKEAKAMRRKKRTFKSCTFKSLRGGWYRLIKEGRPFGRRLRHAETKRIMSLPRELAERAVLVRL